MRRIELRVWLVLAVVAYYSTYFFTTTKLFGNTASRVLLAVGPQLGIGLPYRDLYEIVPPGYLLFVWSWVRVFGMSITSFKAIHVLLVVLSGYLLALICTELFKQKTLGFLVFVGAMLSANAFFIQTDLFAIDLFATTLVLGGLAALLTMRGLFLRVGVAATLFFAASQFKEIYILSAVCLGPIYVRELLRKRENVFGTLLLWSIVGPVAISILLYGYLSHLGIVEDYVQVIQDKMGYRSEMSLKLLSSSIAGMSGSISQFFVGLPNVIVSLGVVSSVLVIRTHWVSLQELRMSWSGKRLGNWLRDWDAYGTSFGGKWLLAVVFMVSVLLGTAVYGLYTGVQIISVVMVLFVIIGLLLIEPVELMEKTWLGRKGTEVVLFGFLVGVPLLSILSQPYYPVKRNATFKLEETIMQRVDPSECIFHVYGWEVAATYIYSERRPCSRYFLVNEFFIFLGSEVERFREDLIESPPAAFIYSDQGADINVDAFEREIMNVRGVLEACYVADPEYTNYTRHFFAPVTVYWPKENVTSEELSACWRDYGMPIAKDA